MRVRLKPGGSLGLSEPRMLLRPGDEADLPEHIVNQWAGRLEIIEPPPASEDVDVMDYHVGGGWYELPTSETRVRKEEAMALLGLDADE